MADHTICDACETVSHCRQHGCIPVTPLAAKGGAAGQGQAGAAKTRRDLLKLAVQCMNEVEESEGPRVIMGPKVLANFANRLSAPQAARLIGCYDDGENGARVVLFFKTIEQAKNYRATIAAPGAPPASPETPVMFAKAQDLADLQTCNGMSVWAESYAAHQDSWGGCAPVDTTRGLVPLFARPAGNSAAPGATIAAREQEDAATLLRKYKKLCVEIGRGDSYHLNRIDNAISSLASRNEASAASAQSKSAKEGGAA